MTSIKTRSTAIEELTSTTRAKMVNLGGRLRAARKRRGWTFAQCAEISGVSTTTLKGIERGEPNIGFGLYVAVLQAYGITTELDGLCLISKDHGLIAPDEPTYKVTFDEDL
jgi:transcriptional regulator with XRE-family HTH domain|tara:strand:- start:776 stop:1108 length:333 start_codon:yes stop_codon:yes gene_type:complete